MNVYCVHYNTDRRVKIATFAEKVFGCEVINPRIIQRKWVRKDALEVVHDLLPGYMFLYSESAIDEIEILANVEGVYRILGSKQGGWRLYGSDRAFAEMLYRNEGEIGIVQAYWDEGRLKLMDRLFDSFDGAIVKIDRRQRALVQYMFDGRPFSVWVGYDVVQMSPAM